MSHTRRVGGLLAPVLLLAAAVASTGWNPARAAPAQSLATAVLKATSQSADMNKIKHVVFIVQENRSFDEYFGMYPGADGIPVDVNGIPTVCVPDPATQSCQKPYH